MAAILAHVALFAVLVLLIALSLSDWRRADPGDRLITLALWAGVVVGLATLLGS